MKGRKTILITLMVLVLMSFMAGAASANPGITVALNNEKIEFASNEQPLVVNGCTYLTLRTVTEKLGGEVEWDNKNQVVTMKVDGKTIMLSPGTEIYFVNGEGFSYTSDAAILVDGRVRVPLRLVGEFLGVGVVWNAEERKIAITSNSGNKQVAVSSGKPVLAAPSTESLSAEQLFDRAKQFEGTPINLEEYYVHPSISRMPYGFKADASIMEIDAADLKPNGIRMGDKKDGFEVILDAWIEDNAVYIKQTGSDRVSVPVVLAEGKDVSRSRPQAPRDRDSYLFTARYDINYQPELTYSNLSKADITNITHVMVVYGEYILAIRKSSMLSK